jgi:uncharacterized lipoprotein YddW (UPF0748 family)
MLQGCGQAANKITGVIRNINFFRAFWKARQNKNFFEKKFYQKALNKLNRFAGNSYFFVVLPNGIRGSVYKSVVSLSLGLRD